jgi:hypothetical protein
MAGNMVMLCQPRSTRQAVGDTRQPPDYCLIGSAWVDWRWSLNPVAADRLDAAGHEVPGEGLRIAPPGTTPPSAVSQARHRELAAVTHGPQYSGHASCYPSPSASGHPLASAHPREGHVVSSTILLGVGKAAVSCQRFLTL